jgi:hypothetical protein
LELLRDRHKLGRCVDEVVAAVFAAAFAAITILVPLQANGTDSTWQHYAPYITASGWLLVLLLLVRILGSTYSRRDTPSAITLRTFFLDQSKWLRIQGRDPGWMPVRYLVLSIPVALYFLGVPTTGQGCPHDDIVERISLPDLVECANSPKWRAANEGNTFRVVGYSATGIGPDGAFLLYEGRHFGDCPKLPVRIENYAAEDVEGAQPWPAGQTHVRVEVIGTLKFFHDARDPKNENPVLFVKPSEARPITNLIKLTDSVPNP